MKSALKKITAYTWAFIALIAVFFTAGMFTLGSVKNTGESVFVEEGKVAYYTLNTASGEKLDGVYVNVGAIYTDVEKDVSITLKTSTSSNPSSTSTTYWPSSGKKTVTITNVTTNTEGKTDGANYNWVPVATSLNKSVKTIGVGASADIELNEIVCLNTDGEKIGLTPFTGTWNDYDGISDKTALTAAFDAQDSFDLSEGAYYRLTPEESYYMASVENVLGGSEIESDGKYPLNENYNYLATVLFMPTVAMFGNSPFALRLPAFVATCVLIVCAYLLIRQLTKSDKLSFVFAILLCLGGMATTIGRLGAPYVMIAAALVTSVYFMYRFFSKGLSSKQPVKGALNILVSGIAAAFALAMDILSIFPIIGILVLFGFGIRRQKLAYKLALAKTEGQEEEMQTEEGETVTVNKAAKAVTAQYNEKNRLSYGFAALGFLMGTVVLTIVSAVLCYTAFIKANGVDEGFLVTIWRGIKNSALSNAVAPYTTANWSSVWAWWLPWRAATVYTGVNGVAAGKYLAWNVTPNTIASCLSLVSLAAVTVKVAYDIVRKKTDKKALRLRRAFFVLLSGMAAAMIAGGLKAQPSPLYAMTFHTLYLGFIPLALTMHDGNECGCKVKKLVSNVVICLIVVAVATVFVLSVPSMYGIVIEAEKAKLFGWTTFVNNGYFR